jgi:hypothetical protein
MILILSRSNEAHGDLIYERLRERGAAVIRFDNADFPANAALSLSYTSAGRARYALHTTNGRIDLDDVGAIMYWRPNSPVPHNRVSDPELHTFVEQECRDVVSDMWHGLPTTWLPGRPAIVQTAQYKASQLRVAGEIGFELPPTLITNSPGDFLEFYRAHGGAIISKLAGYALLKSVGQTFARYTEPVSPRDVAHADAVRYVPTIFQAYVPKRVELRITVVGDRVFPAEIRSQASHHTRHDWRRYDMFATQYAPHDLPRDVESRCVALVQRLGLTYGAIDMIVTPDGRYVFLEINPSGLFLWIERATGLPITDAICDLLVASSAMDRSHTMRRAA